MNIMIISVFVPECLDPSMNVSTRYLDGSKMDGPVYCSLRCRHKDTIKIDNTTVLIWSFKTVIRL